MPHDVSLFLILPAIWYWVIAITDSDGPLNIFEWLREAPFIGGLFSCYICLSIWVAGGMFSLQLFAPALLAVSAIAGLFVAIYRVIAFFTDTLQMFQDNSRLSLAEQLMSQLDNHTTYSADVRNMIYQQYISGQNIEASIMIALQEWGDDAV